VEDEAAVMRANAERETDAFDGVRLTGYVVSDPSAPSRLYVGTEGRELRDESVLLVEIRDAAGRSRWAQAEPRVIGGRDFCEPLPGKCHFPSWLPEGSYFVFSDPRGGPLLPAGGRYEISFESAFRAFRFGPLVFGDQAGPKSGGAKPIQIIAPAR
jgi:hypothetical protein